MKMGLALGGIAAATALAVLAGGAPASAACRGATTGTVVGGVGGALIGNAISHNAGGTILGGIGGAVVGHEIGKSGCGHYHAERGYYRHGRRYGGGYGASSGAAPSGGGAPVYYDPQGRPINPDGAYASAVDTSAGRYAPWGDAPCRTEDQSFYDEHGELATRSVQVCSR